MIEIRELAKSFSGVPVFDRITCSIAAGEILTIFGPNGCGKSTLLRILAGLESADSGLVHIPHELRRSTGVVFQNYRETLLPWRSAQDNILFPLALRRTGSRDAAIALERLLEGSPRTFELDQPVYTLSGGQAQLVALYRALISAPKLLLLDEAAAALDHFMRAQLLELLLSQRERLNLTIVGILHDLDDAIEVSDRLLLMQPHSAAVEVDLSRWRGESSDEAIRASLFEQVGLRQHRRAAAGVR